MRQGLRSSQSTKYPRSLSENIFLSWRGMLKACYVYVYRASCRETERTLEREPVPERALVRDRSISYLPIKGGRFVQFILNHGTVTGCQ